MKPIVLAVDDDPLFQKALESVLSRFGLDIRVTSSAKEFLRVQKTIKPHLYLIDLHLAESSGLDLVSQVRSADSKANIMVISGDRDQAVVVDALEKGANDYIQKPLDRVLLASKLSKYVETPALRENSLRPILLKNLGLEDQSLGIKLRLELFISEVDELGVQLETKHIIPKGSVLKLKSDFFKQIGFTQDEVMVTVVSTLLDYATGLYSSYAEFDSGAQELMELVRRWILTTKVKP